ncbi:hypothetical protein Bca4012_046223 [Brassica carinata]
MFSLSNQPEEEEDKLSEILKIEISKKIDLQESKCRLFCAEVPSWGFPKALPLTKLGFLEKDKLTVEVYIKVVEVVHQGKSTENDIIDFHGFQISACQVFPVANTVFQDPHYVIDFKPENQWVQTKYMYLLGLVETLSKPPQSLSATELSNAQRDLTSLKESGFKIEARGGFLGVEESSTFF